MPQLAALLEGQSKHHVAGDQDDAPGWLTLPAYQLIKAKQLIKESSSKQRWGFLKTPVNQDCSVQLLHLKAPGNVQDYFSIL